MAEPKTLGKRDAAMYAGEAVGDCSSCMRNMIFGLEVWPSLMTHSVSRSAIRAASL